MEHSPKSSRAPLWASPAAGRKGGGHGVEKGHPGREREEKEERPSASPPGTQEHPQVRGRVSMTLTGRGRKTPNAARLRDEVKETQLRLAGMSKRETDRSLARGPQSRLETDCRGGPGAQR